MKVARYVQRLKCQRTGDELHKPLETQKQYSHKIQILSQHLAQTMKLNICLAGSNLHTQIDVMWKLFEAFKKI